MTGKLLDVLVNEKSKEVRKALLASLPLLAPGGDDSAPRVSAVTVPALLERTLDEADEVGYTMAAWPWAGAGGLAGQRWRGAAMTCTPPTVSGLEDVHSAQTSSGSGLHTQATAAKAAACCHCRRAQVRAVVYTALKDAVRLQDLGLEQRLLVLRRGLSDRQPVVSGAATKLLLKWITDACHEDVFELLGQLEVQQNPGGLPGGQEFSSRCLPVHT